MPHALDSAHQKIARARDLLDVLDREIRAFAKPGTYATTIEVDEEGIGHVRVVKVPERIPDLLSLIAGDAIHNLRSALDHLVYQLALLNGGTGESNAFPVFEEPSKYRDNQARLLRDVIPDHRARIEALQPYHIECTLNPRGFTDESRVMMWLQSVTRLDNLDKHRLLLAASAVAPSRSPTFTGVRYARGKWAGEGAWIPVEKGAEFFTIEELDPIGDPSEVKMDPDAVFTIGFGDRDFTPEQYWTDRTKGAVSRADLLLAADAVESVIASFEDAFPGRASPSPS